MYQGTSKIFSNISISVIPICYKTVIHFFNITKKLIPLCWSKKEDHNSPVECANHNLCNYSADLYFQ